MITRHPQIRMHLPSLSTLQQLEVVELTCREVPVVLGTLPNLKHLTLWWLETHVDDLETIEPVSHYLAQDVLHKSSGQACW